MSAAIKIPKMMPQRTRTLHRCTPAVKSDVLFACDIFVRSSYRHSLCPRQLRRGLGDIARGKRFEKSPATGSRRRRWLVRDCGWAVFAVFLLQLRQHGIDERLVGLSCGLGFGNRFAQRDQVVMKVAHV